MYKYYVLIGLCCIDVTKGAVSPIVIKERMRESSARNESIYELNHTRVDIDDYTDCLAGLPLNHRDQELFCCQRLTETYIAKWSNGGYPLSWYLERMRVWKCPEMKEICTKRHFAFNEFTSILHQIYCNETIWREKCLAEIQALPSYQDTAHVQSFEKLVELYNPTRVSDDDLLNPCIQIVEFLRNGSGFGYFHETIQVYVPFCDIVWCGFSSDTIQSRRVSTWDCLPQSCRESTKGVFVVFGILSFLISTTNALVLIVFLSTSKLHNSQAVYKISLAAADFITGAMVFPTFANTLSLVLRTPRQIPEKRSIEDDYGVVVNRSIYRSSTVENDGTYYFVSTGQINAGINHDYIRFCGIVSTVSLAVSVYTLVLAACDRLMVVLRPLKYNKHASKKLAVKLSVLLWILALFGSSIPIIIPTWEYGIIASVLMSASGDYAMIILSIAFFLPIVVLWGVTIATYVMVKRQNRQRMAMVVSRRVKTRKSPESIKERRLTITLSLMVGAFTASVLPAFIVLFVFLFIKEIYTSDMSTFKVEVFVLYNTLEFLIIVIVMSNSLWNFFIYSARNDDFRSATKQLFCSTCPGFFRRIAKRSPIKRGQISRTTRSSTHRTTSNSSPPIRKNSSSVFTFIRNISSTSDPNKSPNSPTKTSGFLKFGRGSRTTSFSKSESNNNLSPDNAKSLPVVQETQE